MRTPKLSDEEIQRNYSCSTHGTTGNAGCKECWDVLGKLCEYYNAGMIVAPEDVPR